MITVQDLEGSFQVSGRNQDEFASTYTGVLKLKIRPEGSILAHWTIGESQEQVGTGFFKSNLLVINFNYGDQQEFKGTVVYKCLTADLLDGFWSEEAANPKYLGSEKAFRIQSKLLN